jgi:hypothetical protein
MIAGVFFAAFNCGKTPSLVYKVERIGGYIEDRNSWEQVVPIIISQNYLNARKINTRKDTDHDGVPDYRDDCPNLYGTLLNGCPDTTIVNPPPPDTDGDGITDSLDKCPTDPGPVSNNGCPVIVNPPSATEVSVTMPPVFNQGGEGACVAFAAIGIRSAEWYKNTGSTSYNLSTNVFSQEFLYDRIKFWDCARGTSMEPALNFLRDTGVVVYNTMPYSSINGCDITLTTSLLSEASLYKINGYSKMSKFDSIAIKSMLAAGHAVMFAYIADNSWINATGFFIWKTQISSTLPHCSDICGYDNSKHAWKIYNSWGIAWGDNGYDWIDYDLFPVVSGNYVYVIN